MFGRRTAAARGGRDERRSLRPRARSAVFAMLVAETARTIRRVFRAGAVGRGGAWVRPKVERTVALLRARVRVMRGRLSTWWSAGGRRRDGRGAATREPVPAAGRRPTPMRASMRRDDGIDLAKATREAGAVATRPGWGGGGLAAARCGTTGEAGVVCPDLEGWIAAARRAATGTATRAADADARRRTSRGT